MEASITLSELGLIVIFALIVVVAVYLILTLKNVNGVLRYVSTTIEKNEGDLHQIMSRLAEISENTAEISSDLREGVKEANQAIQTISKEATDTVLSINKTADYVSTYAVVINEVIKTLLNVFSYEKKKT